MKTENTIEEIPIDANGYPTIRRYYTNQHCPKCADVLAAQWQTPAEPSLGMWAISCAVCNYEPVDNLYYTRELLIRHTLTLQPPPKTHRFFHEINNFNDMELSEMCRTTLSKLCKTGGGSFTMSVPPHVDDTDVILHELLSRFEERCKRVAKLSLELNKRNQELYELKNVGENTN